MFPGYEYILALIFLMCTAVAGVSTTQNNLIAPSYKASSFLSK
ncbi:MAG: hypothetical protein ACRBBP_06070 [Bdellovibrionales bacterium]